MRVLSEYKDEEAALAYLRDHCDALTREDYLDKTQDGQSVLHLAVLDEHPRLFFTTLGMCPDPYSLWHIADKDGNNCLHLALLLEAFEFALQMVRCISFPHDLLDAANHAGQTARNIIVSAPLPMLSALKSHQRPRSAVVLSNHTGVSRPKKGIEALVGRRRSLKPS